MIYAPVLIPTLNRYEHLRQCLESLSGCTWADKTEVYVALDYPPTEQWDKYFPGWKKNSDYLRSVGNMGFKALHVVERAENYGIWLPGQKGNLRSLRQELEKQYDRFILSEDDNVFSPNFLEFMDKGLEKFKNDKSVYALSGYRWYFSIKYDSNTYFRQGVDCTPWSEGIWVSKQQEMDSIDYSWFRKNITLRTILSFLMARDYSSLGSLFEYSRSEHQNERLIDQHIKVIMALKKYQMILPVVPLVRNIGLDGSGITMPQNNSEMQKLYDMLPVSTDPHFDFIGTGYEHFDENQMIYKRGKEWQGTSFYCKRLIKKIIKYILRP